MVHATVQRSFLSLLGWHHFWMDGGRIDPENHKRYLLTLEKIARTTDTDTPIGVYIKLTGFECSQIHQIVFDVMTKTANILRGGEPPFKLIVDIESNPPPLTSDQRAKMVQLFKLNRHLMTVMILCDNHIRMLSTQEDQMIKHMVSEITERVEYLGLHTKCMAQKVPLLQILRMLPNLGFWNIELKLGQISDIVPYTVDEYLFQVVCATLHRHCGGERRTYSNEIRILPEINSTFTTECVITSWKANESTTMTDRFLFPIWPHPTTITQESLRACLGSSTMFDIEFRCNGCVAVPYSAE